MASRANATLQPPQITITGQSLATPPSRNAATPRSRGSSTASPSPRSSRENTAVDQVMEINRRLVTQIETLRLKVEIDAHHQKEAKDNVYSTADAEVKARESKLQELKNDLRGKDDVVKNLKDKNERKESAILRLEENIKELKDDVMVSKDYANEIQSQLELLQSATKNLESGKAYREKDSQIRQLQAEVERLHENLATLEKDLTSAKEKIAQQGTQLRLADIDRLNVQSKFKSDLAKVTQTMRGDIERMRDVMQDQWREMRDLREQNESMSNDIREIRNLVMENMQEGQRLAQTPINNSSQARAYGHAHSPFDLQAMSPSLPVLSPKDKKRMYANGRKKT